MAALRSGVKTVIIPKENEKDLEEIDQTVRKALRFVPVETVDAMFAVALVPEKTAEAVQHLTMLSSEQREGLSCGHQL